MRRFTSSLINRLTDWAIPEPLRLDSDVFRRAKRVALLDVIFMFWTTVFAAVALAVGSPHSAVVTLWCIPVILVSLALLQRGRSPVVCGNALCLAGTTTLIALACLSGGATAPQLLWLVCAAVAAALTAGAASAFVWMLVSVAAVAAFVAAESLGVAFPQELSPHALHVYYFLALAGLIVCHCVLATVRVGIEERAFLALHETNERLIQAQWKLEQLKANFGFSMEEWERLKREKNALDLALSRLVGDADDDDDEEDDELDEALDLAETQSARTQSAP